MQVAQNISLLLATLILKLFESFIDIIESLYLVFGTFHQYIFIFPGNKSFEIIYFILELLKDALKLSYLEYLIQYQNFKIVQS